MLLKALYNKIESELEKSTEGLMILVAGAVFGVVVLATTVTGLIGSYLLSYDFTIMNSIITFIVFMTVLSVLFSFLRNYNLDKDEN